jgi:hypothetical protein
MECAPKRVAAAAAARILWCITSPRIAGLAKGRLRWFLHRLDYSFGYDQN